MAHPFTSYTLKSILISAILFLITGLIAAAGARHFGSHFAYYAVASAVIVGLNTLRVMQCSGCEVKRVGEVAVQAGWLVTSLSLVYITLAPAKIYSMNRAYLAITEVLGVILLVLGATLLYKAKKEAGVPLSI